MKQIQYLLFLFVIFSSCQNQDKFGYVDRSIVINGYEKKVNIEDRFQIKNEAFINKRDSLIRQYESERQAASLRVQSMTQEELQQLSREFQQREAQLGQQIQAEQQELQQAFDAEIDSVIKEVKDYVVSYGKANNYTFIFGTSDATNTVMFSSETNDISQTILDQLNADYKNKIN
ncbi:MAG: OmpH family outer membrane protein [Bacteroidota bacterium]